MLMPKEDLRYLQEKYANLLKNDEGLPDCAVSSTEKNDRPRQDNKISRKRVLLIEMLFILPLSFIICSTVFFHVWILLFPGLNLDKIFNLAAQRAALRATSIAFPMLITPMCYILWLSFCLILLLARLYVIAQFKILFSELSTILACFVPTMWLWFLVASALLHLKRMFMFIIDSTLALEAWGLLAVFATLFMLMVAIFLRGYLLMLYRSYEDSEAAQDRARIFKNKFLCFATVVFTAVIIVYV